MIYIALFGPPGAGKGTQAKKIIEKYNLEHISTGEIIRREIADKTELGKQAENIINKGHLLSDELVIALLEDTMSKSHNRKGFLLDGFPRNVKQAKDLDAMLAKRGASLNVLINIKAPSNCLMRRMLKRAGEEGRPDDTPEVIENRFKVYENQTQPVEEYYKCKGITLDVDGNKDVDSVFEQIVQLLDTFNF
ncbi:MAG: adenylate kinase [Culturomica sp.]|jgi:adenylate kinase|nr:adenylate kinase [Culturomica sp.]